MAIRKIFAFVRRDMSNGQEIIQLSSRREKSKDIKCVLCEGNHPANYKGCMVYKDLQRNFLLTLRRKVVTSELQS